MKSSALVLTLLLALSPSLFADDHGKGKGKEDRGEHKGKVVKVERDRDDDERVPVRRVVVRRPVVVPVAANRIVIINNDVNRIESLLATAQTTTVVIPGPTLIRVGNEANVLANRISANVRTALRTNPTAVSAARNLRMHIREMHAATARGDFAAAQAHARLALPFAIRLDGIV